MLSCLAIFGVCRLPGSGRQSLTLRAGYAASRISSNLNGRPSNSDGCRPRNRPPHSHAASEKLNSVVRVEQTGPRHFLAFVRLCSEYASAFIRIVKLSGLTERCPFPKSTSSMTATPNRYHAVCPRKIRALTLDYTPRCSV